MDRRMVTIVLLGASAAGQVPTAPRANKFPVLVSLGAIAGQPERVRAGFDVFFPAEKARYFPVDEKMAELLSSPPEVRARPGWDIRVLSSVCRPKTMRVETGGNVDLGTGGRIEIEVEITPGPPDADSTQEVVLAFPLVDYVRTRVGGRPAASPAEVRLQVKVWANQQAKLEAERWIEAERQRVMKETRAQRIRTAWRVLLAAILITGLVYLRRRWLWPTLREQVSAGEILQCPAAFPLLTHNQESEPGTIVATAWAKTRLGRRRRIKVEVFAGSFSQDDELEPKLLISVGASLQPGTYLAKLSGGAVLVKVVPRVH